MSIRKYYIDVVEGRSSGGFPAILKFFLGILSFVYLIAVNFKNWLYDSGIRRQIKVDNIKVISVGNLTWGGTGKTSMSIYIGKNLNVKTAVLTRGYGKDEVELLRRKLEATPAQVFVGKDRAGILSEICNDYKAAVLDDGFQYRKLKKDLNIVLVNAKRPFGNGSVLPRGSLREPKSALKRADLIVVMYSENSTGLEPELKKINPDAEIFRAEYVSTGLFDLSGRKSAGLDTRKDRWACFTAIGYPEGFLGTLEIEGIKPALKFIYPDHYNLKEAEFRKIEKECMDRGISSLIITEKDKDRFGFESLLNIYIAGVVFKIHNCQNFVNRIRDVLAD